ncbi:MAG: tetratricopeptide repeat protein, partial [Pyrinomonadaceae bacterium]
SAAAGKDSVEDERFALSHLVVIRPHETRFRDRLDEINAEFGFEDTLVDEELLRAQFAPEVASEFQTEYVSNGSSETSWSAIDSYEFERNVEAAAEFVPEAADVTPGIDPQLETHGSSGNGFDLSLASELKLQKELESISFYIENDYHELAEKALIELSSEFGNRSEIEELKKRIGLDFEAAVPVPAVLHPEIVEVEIVKTESASAEFAVSTIGIDEIRSEFGLEGGDEPDDGDFETHYNTAMAYKEMGLTEEAIREFQDAVNLTAPTDGTRHFFQCANLLGHCFLENGKANHAITWFKRALDTPNISDEEHHGLWYELGLAYEANSDEYHAAKYFEKIYAENVDFRDVGERVKTIVINQ